MKGRGWRGITYLHTVVKAKAILYGSYSRNTIRMKEVCVGGEMGGSGTMRGGWYIVSVILCVVLGGSVSGGGCG